MRSLAPPPPRRPGAMSDDERRVCFVSTGYYVRAQRSVRSGRWPTRTTASRASPRRTTPTATCSHPRSVACSSRCSRCAPSRISRSVCPADRGDLGADRVMRRCGAGRGASDARHGLGAVVLLCRIREDGPVRRMKKKRYVANKQQTSRADKRSTGSRGLPGLLGGTCRGLSGRSEGELSVGRKQKQLVRWDREGAAPGIG